MLKRLIGLGLSVVTGLLASAALLALAQHPAGVAWAAPNPHPLAAVLTVGGACGPTIQGCLDAAQPGDEVHIPAGQYTESLTVAKSISVTGDLSSTTIIHAVDSQRVMTITTASVYLADLTLTGGVFTTTHYAADCGGDLQVKYAAAQLENVILSGGTATCGGGLGVMTASVTLSGVNFISNTADFGGGVSTIGAGLMMSSGAIEHNAAQLYGGGGFFLDANTQMLLAGGQVYSNSTLQGGGLALGRPGVVLTQTGGSIVGNAAQQSGGGVVLDGVLFTMLGGTIESNTVVQRGGGIAVFGGSANTTVYTGQVVLAGGDVAGNSAGLGGGGVYLNGPRSYFTQTSGTVEHNSAVYFGGGLYQEGGLAWLAGTGQIYSNTAGQQGGGVSLYLSGSVFTQTGGSVSSNAAPYGGGFENDGASVTLLGGNVVSNSAQYGGGIASYSDINVTQGVTTYLPGQLVLAGGQVASNTAVIEGGGVYLKGPVSYFTHTAGAIEDNQAFLAGGLAMEGGQASLLGADIVRNHATTAGGVAVLGPDSIFNQTGGQISFNTGGGLLIGNTGAATVTINGGLIYSNTSGGISIDRGTLLITGSRLLSNTNNMGASGLYQWAPVGPVSVTVAHSCVSGNGPITSVVNASGPTVDARGNWWGAANGPGGVGPGSGDAVSSGVDYSGFLAAPPVAGCPAPTVTLTVAKNGAGAGAVTSSPGGIDCGLVCVETVYEGAAMTLTATPAVSSTFRGWSGACTGVDSCAIPMTADTQVTATFALKTYSLTVSPAGNGSGSVSSIPAGIDCGGTCGHTFDYGTIVTLTAIPPESSLFAGWSGACGGAGACVVTMTQSTAVTATFSLNAYSLTVGRAGSGLGSVTSLPSGINCGAICGASFSYGTVVSLTAQPAISSTFTGWSGACGGGGSCVVSLIHPSVVTATFALKAYTVTVALSGTGSGQVTSLPAGLDCGLTCAASFQYGTVLTLTAVPTTGSRFAGWSGSCGGVGACALVVTQAVTLTATFSPLPPQFRMYLPMIVRPPAGAVQD